MKPFDDPLAIEAELRKEIARLRKRLDEAELACLEAQEERDAFRERLNRYEPPFRPEKFA